MRTQKNVEEKLVPSPFVGMVRERGNKLLFTLPQPPPIKGGEKVLVVAQFIGHFST